MERRCWVFFTGEPPPQWRTRANSGFMVALAPRECADLATGVSPAPSVDPEDDVLMQLLSGGASVPAMARALRVSVRTVHRRLAALRRRLGVASTAELVELLSDTGLEPR